MSARRNQNLKGEDSQHCLQASATLYAGLNMGMILRVPCPACGGGGGVHSCKGVKTTDLPGAEDFKFQRG
jgi:hypothetical protein